MQLAKSDAFGCPLGGVGTTIHLSKRVHVLNDVTWFHPLWSTIVRESLPQ